MLFTQGVTVRTLWKTGILLAAFCSVDSVAVAAETVTFTYDAKGRLVKVERAGGVNNGVKAEYTHDRANNRRNLKVTGSTNPAP
jgi:YD repeat-containing protein